MSKHGTKIEWTHFPGYKGETWNPVVGCSHISAGCDNCYAEKMARRLAAMGNRHYQDVVNAPNLDYGKGTKWNGKTCFVESALDKPSCWKKPRSIFVCSMSDLFHEETSGGKINKIWLQIMNNPRHLFLILTKRPVQMLGWTRAMAKLNEWPAGVVWPDNVWLGVTAENQQTADERIPILLQTPCAHRFVSVEPMLGRVDIEKHLTCKGCGTRTRKHLPPGAVDCCPDGGPMLDWVICGGESGKGVARPLEYTWAEQLYLQCRRAGVPFFMKQWSEYGGWNKHDIPDGLSSRKEFPEVSHDSRG